MKIRPRTILALLVLLGAIYFLVKVISVYWLIIAFNILLIYINCVFLFAYLEFRKKKKQPLGKWPSVSVVIPNYNGAANLLQCIRSVKAMEYPVPKEIIVVDDGSTDASVKILKGIKGIRVIFKKKNEGKAKGLNDAIKMAKGEIIAAIDSDTFPEKDALLEMAKHFDSPDVGAVTGLVRTYKPKSFVEKIQEIEYLISFGFFQSVLADINGVMVTPGPMSLFRKKVLAEIGYFDETNITEDMEIAMRLQHNHYRIASAPQAIIYTVVPDNLSHWFRQRTRWYRGKFVNTRKYADMVLNPKYGEFGMFSFPFSLLADSLAILLIAITVAANIENIVNYFGFIFSWFSLGGGVLGAIPTGFSLHSSIYFYFFTIILYSFLVYVSHNFVNDRLSVWKLPEIIFYMFVYGFFISFVYFVSFFKEINSSDYVW
ncbi:MAG: glycosyltransferase family 2 protein [archaeon]|nr:glycosyltransferase family 2 protein [archaeon]